MIYDDINTDRFIEFKYGNIHYELKEKCISLVLSIKPPDNLCGFILIHPLKILNH